MQRTFAVAIAAGLVCSAAGAHEQQFAADFSGADPAATGSASLTLSEDHSELSYAITLQGLDLGGQTTGTDDDVIGLHFHNAPAGSNGPVVFGNRQSDFGRHSRSFAFGRRRSQCRSGKWHDYRRMGYVRQSRALVCDDRSPDRIRAVLQCPYGRISGRGDARPDHPRTALVRAPARRHVSTCRPAAQELVSTPGSASHHSREEHDGVPGPGRFVLFVFLHTIYGLHALTPNNCSASRSLLLFDPTLRFRAVFAATGGMGIQPNPRGTRRCGRGHRAARQVPPCEKRIRAGLSPDRENVR